MSGTSVARALARKSARAPPTSARQGPRHMLDVSGMQVGAGGCAAEALAARGA